MKILLIDYIKDAKGRRKTNGNCTVEIVDNTLRVVKTITIKETRTPGASRYDTPGGHNIPVQCDGLSALHFCLITRKCQTSTE